MKTNIRMIAAVAGLLLGSSVLASAQQSAPAGPRLQRGSIDSGASRPAPGGATGDRNVQEGRSDKTNGFGGRDTEERFGPAGGDRADDNSAKAVPDDQLRGDRDDGMMDDDKRSESER